MYTFFVLTNETRCVCKTLCFEQQPGQNELFFGEGHKIVDLERAS